MENGQEETAMNGRLLTAEERAVCQQIAAGDPPFGQRAQALLAIDEGASQRAAGEAAGLNPWQVRYWRDKFREEHLDIFPEAVLAAAAVEQATAATSAPASAEAPTMQASKKKSQKGNGKKSGKKKKRAKKGKKAKANSAKKKKGKKSGKKKKKSKKKKKK